GFVVPFGKANKLMEGDEITIVTWGAMCERSEEAVEKVGVSADVIDLRTLMPWDKQAVLDSIQRTNRCLIVHEDNRTAGFGAEIAAVLVREAFQYLDAPVERITMPDIPVPYNVGLMESVLPTTKKIVDKIEEILKF
ncbi:transketolase C-terminal domain-containing protein, partial [Gracilimonas sp.]|uniref:transketolase C-terminal domain-containing protein n=1 Tax=Gracilimonas sp. TaxID=1974203 RepID=UPI002871B5F1|nr:transketolase C-terminal domain-containing protein [Gracilimonas sp.]